MTRIGRGKGLIDEPEPGPESPDDGDQTIGYLFRRRWRERLPGWPKPTAIGAARRSALVLDDSVSRPTSTGAFPFIRHGTLSLPSSSAAPILRLSPSLLTLLLPYARRQRARALWSMSPLRRRRRRRCCFTFSERTTSQSLSIWELRTVGAFLQ